jgi:hypothetical protein
MGSDDFSLTASTAQRSIDQRDKASVKKLTLPSLHVLYSLMVGNKPKSTRVGMKKLVTTIALLCLSSTVLAHDIYSGLRDRDGHLCCGGQDCKPVEATVLPNGSYYLPATGEIIPADMATPSPDDRFHHCAYYRMLPMQFDSAGPVWESTPRTRCFFAPMNSS